MQFYPIRQIQGNCLLTGCLKCNFLCPLLIPVYISGHIGIRKRHLHIWNIRLSDCIIVQFLCQSFPGTVCSIERITAPVGVGGSQMCHDKPFSGGKIGVIMVKEIG